MQKTATERLQAINEIFQAQSNIIRAKEIAQDFNARHSADDFYLIDQAAERLRQFIGRLSEG